ncbi:MAG TPA: PEP-CTERM sorting domain-containing protein [Longimicrobiaceae bacterium]|jgi:hypothetical protein|nr:PEP-CTERM sorting domain-containing protein [Longimicrobiaceae bacterium]
MKGRWMLVLAALCAAPAAAAAQRYTINPWAGITAENIRNYETGMRSSFTSRFENGVMVERGGFGQAFTIGQGSTLLSFGLFHDACRPYAAGATVNFTGPCLFRQYVAGLDPASGAVTDVLWESPVFSPVYGAGRAAFMPGVWLDPGRYAIFALWEPDPPAPGFTGWAIEDYSELYPIGSQPPASPGTEQVRLASRDPGVPVGETVWTVSPTHDVQGFYATLDTTVTPEPATMALLGTGLAALAGAARRRRRREAVAE